MEGVTERVGNEIRPSGVSVCFSSLVNCLQVHSLRNNSVCLAAGLGLLIMTMNGCMCFICTFGFFSDKHAHTQVEIHTFPSMLCSFCVPHCVHSTQTNGRERERERERERTFLNTSATFCIDKQRIRACTLRVTISN